MDFHSSVSVAVVIAASEVSRDHWIVMSSPGRISFGVGFWEEAGGDGLDVQTRSSLPDRPSEFPPLEAPRLVMERGIG